jgi:hypothetical protein
MIWPFSTIADLRRALFDAQQTIDDNDLRYTRRMNEIAMLQRALADAERNDSPQDPKTGKFAKKAK